MTYLYFCRCKPHFTLSTGITMNTKDDSSWMQYFTYFWWKPAGYLRPPCRVPWESAWNSAEETQRSYSNIGYGRLLPVSNKTGWIEWQDSVAGILGFWPYCLTWVVPRRYSFKTPKGYTCIQRQGLQLSIDADYLTWLHVQSHVDVEHKMSWRNWQVPDVIYEHIEV